MEQISSSNVTSAEYAPSLIDRLKRVVITIGCFFDLKAYKDEIARYESGLPQKSRHENEPQAYAVAGDREAAIS